MNKEEFNKKLTEIQERCNQDCEKLRAEINKPGKVNRKLERGEAYFFIDTQGQVSGAVWDNDRFDDACYEYGNTYLTKEAAEKVAEQRKILAIADRMLPYEYYYYGDKEIIEKINSIYVDIGATEKIILNLNYVNSDKILQTRDGVCLNNEDLYGNILTKLIEEIGEDRIRNAFGEE